MPIVRPVPGHRCSERSPMRNVSLACGTGPGHDIRRTRFPIPPRSTPNTIKCSSTTSGPACSTSWLVLARRCRCMGTPTSIVDPLSEVRGAGGSESASRDLHSGSNARGRQPRDNARGLHLRQAEGQRAANRRSSPASRPGIPVDPPQSSTQRQTRSRDGRTPGSASRQGRRTTTIGGSSRWAMPELQSDRRRQDDEQVEEGRRGLHRPQRQARVEERGQARRLRDRRDQVITTGVRFRSRGPTST